jgi:hypothetical protein
MMIGNIDICDCLRLDRANIYIVCSYEFLEIGRRSVLRLV